MSEPARKFAIRKIMVALESSDHSLAALDAAAQLAALLQAELHGLFVEDINLLRLAELPIGHQVQFHSGIEEQLDPTSLGRALRVQANRLRTRLAGAAERARVSYTFRSVQGQVAEELLIAAREIDLLIVGRACASKTRAPLGSTARVVASRSTPSVLVVRRGAAFRPPLRVVFEDSEAGDRALGAALELAAATGHALTVMLVAGPGDDARELQERASRRLHSGSSKSSIVRVADLPALVRMHNEVEDGTLLISADSRLLQGEGVVRLLNAIDIPVFLIR